jgi:hypothetical protein
MVDKIIGQSIPSLSKIGHKPEARPAVSERNFMDVLRDKFSEVTSQMKNVPGMPGVYSFNPQNASVDAAAISDKGGVSSLV